MSLACRRVRLTALCVASLLLPSLGNTAAQQGGKKTVDQAAPKIVKTILKVDYRVQEISPPNLVVTAVGQVNTGGFTKPMLLRVQYATPPADGIQDYVLFAVPPSGPATQVISEVKASDTWNRYMKEAPWLKGIRVHGVDDDVVVTLLPKQP